jgi:hypothetical protein
VGCGLHDTGNDHAVAMPLVIPPGAYVSLARSPNIFCTDMGFPSPGFTPDYSYGPSIKLANEGDELWITCGGTEIDRVDFLTWPVDNGVSFSLDPGSLDAAANDARGSWCSGRDIYNMGGGEMVRAWPEAPRSG